MRRRLRLPLVAALLVASACAARSTLPDAGARLPDAAADTGVAQEPPGTPNAERGWLRTFLAKNRGSLLGVGASVRVAGTPGSEVGNAVDFSPLVRFGAGTGWAPSIGFSWITRELLAPGTSSTPLADLRVRPLMVGVAYNRLVGPAQLSASLVGGYAFTRLERDVAVAGGPRATDVAGSFAWRPSASVWFATTDRLGLQVAAGYLVARPRVTFTTGDRVDATRVRADALMISVGAAWWVF